MFRTTLQVLEVGKRPGRLIQEIVLGIGGWAMLDRLAIEIDVCHLNEGHPAFAVLERARGFMKKADVSFPEACWATRAGNLFTTHTPVAAGFDIFPPQLIEKYFRDYVAELGISLCDLLVLGRRDAVNTEEPFNMAYLALRGCASANAVSRLHGEVSRHLFRELYPRWPEREVPTCPLRVRIGTIPHASRLTTRMCARRTNPH